MEMDSERILRGVRELRGLRNFRGNAAQPRRKLLRDNETDAQELKDSKGKMEKNSEEKARVKPNA